jgi:hypothetical protein
MAENGRAICLIENRKLHEGFQESSANARLIAAAPDLLAALIAFDNAFSHYCEGDPDSDEVSALYQAREAIAKATGETA